MSALGALARADYKAMMAGGKPQKSAAPDGAAKRGALSRAAQARVAEIFERFAAATPEPKTELEYTNNFTLLVAVALSAQATDAGVNKATRALFAIADTPEKMAALGEAGLMEKIKTIGLYRNKAKNIIAMSRALLRDHGGAVPATREALEALPGVGRKTANVVLNVAFGAETIAVDTHVFRVANRIPLAKGKTPAEVEAGLEQVIPTRFKRNAHHWLILHGRYTCTARSPRCGACIIVDLCRFPGKTV
jgi:endonuclease III